MAPRGLPEVNFSAALDAAGAYREIAKLANEVAVSMNTALSANSEIMGTSVYKKMEKVAQEAGVLKDELIRSNKALEDMKKREESLTKEANKKKDAYDKLEKKLNERKKQGKLVTQAQEDSLAHLQKITQEKMDAVVAQKEEIELGQKRLQQLAKEGEITQKMNKKRMQANLEALAYQKDNMEALKRDIKTAGGGKAGAFNYMAKGLSSNFGSAGGLTIDRITGGLGDKISDLGSLINGLGGKMGSGMMSGLGSVLGKAGPIVGGFMAVGQAAMDADKKIKDANKGILETSNIADITGPSLTGLNEKIGFMRKAFLDLNAEVGLDDSKELFSSLSGAGYDFRLMGRDTGKMKGTMRELAKASSALGIGFSDGAEFMAMFRKELGIDDLNKIAGAFTDIRDAAVKAGMNTKDLADSVKKLYAGLGKFNIGIHQVTNTFLKLRRVIGKDAAEEMMESLKGGYSESGTKERIEAGLKMGEGNMKKIVGRTAQRSTANLISDIRSNKNMQAMFRGAGFTATSGEELQKELAALSPEERAKRLVKMREAGEGMNIEDVETLQERMRSAMNVSKGAKGSIAGGGLLKGMGEIDIAGMLSSKVLGAAALGGRFKEGKLHEIVDPAELVALETMTGMSAKQIRGMQAITEDMHGELSLLQERAKTGKLSDKEKEKYSIGPDGKLIEKETGEEVTFQKYLEMNEKEIDKRAKEGGLIEQTTQDMMKEQILATRSVADQINAKLGQYLDSINATASAILDMGRKDSTKATRQTATREVDAEIAKAQATIADKNASAGAVEKAKKALELAQGKKRYLATATFEENESKEIMLAKASAEAEAQLNPEDAKALAKKRLLELGTEAGATIKKNMTTRDIAKDIIEASDSKISKEKKAEAFRLMGTLGYQAKEKTYGVADFDPNTGKRLEDKKVGTNKFDFVGEGESVYQLTPEEQKKLDIDTAKEEKKATEKGDEKLLIEAQKKADEDFLKNLDKMNNANEIIRLIKDTTGVTDEQKGKLASIQKELSTALTGGNLTEFERLLTGAGLQNVQNMEAFREAQSIFGGGAMATPTESGEAGDWVKVGNKIHKFSNSDIAFGVDPAGMKGPLKDILGGGGGMAKGMVNITINGGDEQRVYAVVQRALSDAGYGRM